MDREQKRVFKFVNYVVTKSQSDALLRLRVRLARGLEPISISVLLEWFYLDVKNSRKEYRRKIERELNLHAAAFHFPNVAAAQRTGARLDNVVVDWIVATTHQTANTGLSVVLSYLSKSKNKILSQEFAVN